MRIRWIAFGFCSLLISNILLPSRILSQDSLTLIWQDESKSEAVRLEAINTYYKKQTYAKPEDVLKLTFLHEKLAANTNDQKEVSKALGERSYANFIMGDVKNSMKALKQGIAVLEKLNDEVGLATFYANLAPLVSAEGQHKDAIDYYHKSLDVFRKVGNWENEALTLNNIGTQLINLEGYDLALNHFEEALAIFKSKGRIEGTGYILAGMSEVYFNQGKLDLAINTGKESVILLEKDNNLATKTDACFVLAKAYLEKGDKNRARLYLDESLQISKEVNNNSLIFDRLIFDAKLSLDDDMNIATKKAENLLSQLNGEISHTIKSQLYELLYNCYKGQGKYNLSLEMYEKHKIYSDSAATQKIKIDIMRQVIQKEHEDKLLKNEIESKKLQSELSTKHSYKLIGIIILGLILIGTLLYISRAKSLVEQQTRKELLNELEILKKKEGKVVGLETNTGLNKEKLERAIDKKINETDWIVLNLLVDDPVISNKDLSDRAYLSVDGIGSSLRRMYEYYDIPNSKYMKIALLLKAIKISNNGNV